MVIIYIYISSIIVHYLFVIFFIHGLLICFVNSLLCFSMYSVLFLCCMILDLSFLFRSSSITLVQKAKNSGQPGFVLFAPGRSTKHLCRSLFLMISPRVHSVAMLLLTVIISQNQVLRSYVKVFLLFIPQSMVLRNRPFTTLCLSKAHRGMVHSPGLACTSIGT